MGIQPFYGKGPYLLLWHGLCATHGKIRSGIPSHLNSCVIFTVTYKCGHGQHNTTWGGCRVDTHCLEITAEKSNTFMPHELNVTQNHNMKTGKGIEPTESVVDCRYLRKQLQ